MICPKCGNSLPEGSKFCLNCGNPVETQSEAQVKNTPPANTVSEGSVSSGVSADDYKTVAVTDGRYESSAGSEGDNAFIDFRSNEYKNKEPDSYDDWNNDRTGNSAYDDWNRDSHRDSYRDDRSSAKKKRLILIIAGAAVVVIGVVIAVICIINCNGGKSNPGNPDPAATTTAPAHTETAAPTQAPTSAPTTAPTVDSKQLIRGEWYCETDALAEMLTISSARIDAVTYTPQSEDPVNTSYSYSIDSSDTLTLSNGTQSGVLQFVPISDTSSLADGTSPLQQNQWYVDEDYLVLNSTVYERVS